MFEKAVGTSKLVYRQRPTLPQSQRPWEIHNTLSFFSLSVNCKNIQRWAETAKKFESYAKKSAAPENMCPATVAASAWLMQHWTPYGIDGWGARHSGTLAQGALVPLCAAPAVHAPCALGGHASTGHTHSLKHSPIH